MLSLKIPNYYDATGKPVDPLIDSKTGGAYYQDAAGNRTVPVVFYITNDVMYRNLNGLPTAIATNVKDFDIFPIDSATDPNASTDFNFTGISGKVAEVKLQIRFKTNFSEQFATGGVNSSTALYNTTLLRNVRTDAATGLY